MQTSTRVHATNHAVNTHCRNFLCFTAGAMRVADGAGGEVLRSVTGADGEPNLQQCH